MGSVEPYSVLQSQLSERAKVVGSEGTVDRWDGSCAPNPKLTVFPANEQDVAVIVKYCRENGLKCLAQGVGHGWRIRNSDKVDVIICLRNLKSIDFAEDGKSVTIGGGTLVKELHEAAEKKGLEVVSGTCNTVGAVGSLLYGGVSRYMGKYGMGIDNLISLNFVDAAGRLHENINETSDADLWWALKGAGGSFGIVTKVTFKAYPVKNGGLSWVATILVPDPSKVEKVAEVAESIELTPDMCFHIIYGCAPPTFTPAILISLWYYGPEEEAKAVYKPFFDLQPIVIDVGMVGGGKINDGTDPFCDPQGRKPGVGLGITKLGPSTCRKVWDSFVSFVSKNPQAGRSVILAEYMPRHEVTNITSETACFGNRDTKYEVICIPWYDDPSFDETAKAWSASIRDIWVKECSHPDGRLRSYAPFSGIDEPLESMFRVQEKVNRLKELKAKWDPDYYWDAFLPST